MRAGTPSDERTVSRWERRLPWAAGLIGALIFVRPLFAAPASSILERAFWWDTFANIDDLIDLHRSLSAGPQGRNFWDWLYSGHFFFPQPRPLLTSELMPLAAFVSWPLARWPVLAHNLLLTTALVLNCVAAASLARAFGARAIAATIAGVVFAFSSYTNSISSRLQLLFLFPMAWALAATVRWARDGRWRDAWLAVGWTVAQTLLCLYYATFLALTLPAFAIVARLTVRRRWTIHDWLRLAVPAAVLLPPAVFVLWPYTELRTKLGMIHPYKDVLLQSGDPWIFRGADPSLLMSRWFIDTMKWDTAVFPGVVALIGGTLALYLWLRRAWLGRGAVLLVALLAMWPASHGYFEITLALWCGLVIVLLWRARQGRLHPAIPSLLVLALIGLVLFEGPEPRAFDKPLGWSPYHWLYDEVSVVQGLRMVRRAVLLMQLALAVIAGLAFSQLERGGWGRVALGVVLLFALLEGVPWKLTSRPAPTSCEDPAKQWAAEHDLAAIGDLSEGRAKESDLSLLRHQATLCRVAVPQGFAGFWPPLADMTVDAVNALPDPAAHAWLWQAGIRHVEIRSGSAKWRAERRAALAPIAETEQDLNGAELIALRPPATTSDEPTSHLPGPRVTVLSAMCGDAACGILVDRSENGRWTSNRPMGGNETIVLRFAGTTVAGLEWRAKDRVTDLPRGLRIEQLVGTDMWAPWREYPSLSPLRFGRNAVDASVAIPLEPRRTTALRITQTGRSLRYWLSANEIEVIQGDETNVNARVR